MNDINEIAYPLTEEELFFLTRMMSLKPVFGANDPYKGFLVDEIEERYDVIEKDLLAKLYLLKGEDGGLEMAPLLGACLLACGADDGIQLAKRTEAGRVYQANLYVTPNIVAEITPDDGKEGALVIRPLASAEDTLGELFGFFPEEAPTKRQWAVQLRDMDMEEWAALPVQEQSNRLLAGGLDPDAAFEAVQAFRLRDSQGAMRKWKREARHWLAAGIQYVGHGEKTFLASEQPGRSLRIETYKVKTVDEFLSSFAGRFVGEAGAGAGEEEE
jgi:hypothetical protein